MPQIIKVPFIHNGVTGGAAAVKVLRNEVPPDGLDLDPLLMPRLSFGHEQHNESGPVVRQHQTAPNDGSVVITNGVDLNPLLLPKCDFSHRVSNGACGCKAKPAAVTNSNGYDTEPLVAPKLSFSGKS